LQNTAGVIAIIAAIFRVDEKLAQMEQAETEWNARHLSARTNEATMLAKDDFALEKQAIYAKIDKCMLQQGYTID